MTFNPLGCQAKDNNGLYIFTFKSGMEDISRNRIPWVGNAELGIFAKTTDVHASVMLS